MLSVLERRIIYYMASHSITEPAMSVPGVPANPSGQLIRPTTIMQIVHDLNVGGMQRVVVDLCVRTDPARYKMMVCCFNELGPNADLLARHSIPVHLLKKKAGIDTGLPLRLRRLFLENRVQIVHTHGINPFFYGTLGARMAGCRVIQTDHARGPFPVKKREMYSEMVLSILANKVVAVSEGVKADLIRYEHMSPRKTMVIYNGIDGASFAKGYDGEDLKRKLGILPGDFVLGISCRITKEKGVGQLIEAVSQISPAMPNIKAVIIGDGEPRKEFELLAKELGVLDRIVFTGYRNDIPALIQIMDIFTLPSFTEGHPIVLLEAMAARKPIVATDIPGIRETVVHEKTGLLVQPRDSRALAAALTRLIVNPELRAEMAESGYQRYLERFTIDTAMKRYEALYDTVCPPAPVDIRAGEGDTGYRLSTR